ncbi:MAG: hypothetical protein SPE18_12270, partial [Candidatus Limivicinus sp.]|nr:hypothetical protein [Candidatus Limivicinus sp.]
SECPPFAFVVQLADRTSIIAKGVFISSSPLKLFRTTRLASGFTYTKKHLLKASAFFWSE